jgi:hypothetical protein
MSIVDIVGPTARGSKGSGIKPQSRSMPLPDGASRRPCFLILGVMQPDESVLACFSGGAQRKDGFKDLRCPVQSEEPRAYHRVD